MLNQAVCSPLPHTHNAKPLEGFLQAVVHIRSRLRRALVHGSTCSSCFPGLRLVIKILWRFSVCESVIYYAPLFRCLCVLWLMLWPLSMTKLFSWDYHFIGLCTLYWLACQVRVTAADSGLCCVHVASFECELTPLFVEIVVTLCGSAFYFSVILLIYSNWGGGGGGGGGGPCP